jgi:hypothetical protein
VDLVCGPWSRLRPGDRIEIVKLAPDGREAARYPATVAIVDAAVCWLAVRAVWTSRRIDLGGLSFVPGDTLVEWFSPTHPFNAFAIVAPGDQFRGWYANVTLPARLAADRTPPFLIWHDLYVDLIALPDGRFTIRDEDELAGSGLMSAKPELYRLIIAARDELIARYKLRQPPFALSALPAGTEVLGSSHHKSHPPSP